jgi:MoaA/NifB/PqqE/SkfB family radical SAM enzyme
MTTYDFANILFAGPCNQRCPYCIGQQLDPALNRNNLATFPLPNLCQFTALIRHHHIRQITFTGTNTDPQLYGFEQDLIAWLRKALPGVQISLHTNGQLALAKLSTLNRYDRATISFPSFDAQTFVQMTGVRRMPDLAAILRQACIPIKISCVLGRENVSQVPSFLAHCHRLDVKRVVFRLQYGNPVLWHPPAMLRQVGTYRGNLVYDHDGIQVTFWRFGHTLASSINLFADGSISTEYLLAKHHRFSEGISH